MTPLLRSQPCPRARPDNNEIPEPLLTPNAVQTRIGTLDFVDGVPTKAWRPGEIERVQ